MSHFEPDAPMWHRAKVVLDELARDVRKHGWAQRIAKEMEDGEVVQVIAYLRNLVADHERNAEDE